MNRQMYYGTELPVTDCWMYYPDIYVTLEGALSPRSKLPGRKSG